MAQREDWRRLADQVPGVREVSEEIFYLVWCPEKGSPTHQHGTYEDALNEAQRLARNNPGSKFYVLRAGEYFEKTDVVHIVLLETDGMPF